MSSHDGRFWIVSGPGTRKSRNLAENPNCVISVGLPGIDLVVEGTAERVTDDATLQRLADEFLQYALAGKHHGFSNVRDTLEEGLDEPSIAKVMGGNAIRLLRSALPAV